MKRVIAFVLALAGCAIHSEPVREVTAPVVSSHGDRCASPPDAVRGKFRHGSNAFWSGVGDPRHRGYDLIAVETDENQTLGGKLAYSAADNDTEDERVEVFACVDHDWRSVGSTRTGRDGRFTITLAGPNRLPAGMRDLYGVVRGDGSGFRFLAYVAKAGETVVVTDIDGTITRSEGAVLNSVLFGDDIGHRANAPAALASSGHVVVYVSSRGDQLTAMTRSWLRKHGFPPGPIRHARKSITRPGPKTVAFKTAVLRDLAVPIHAAIGNRATDVDAYLAAGIPADKIFVKLPEFERELAAQLAARKAIPFSDYASIAARLR